MIFYKSGPKSFFFCHKKNIFLSNLYSVRSDISFDVYYLSVGQKLAISNICLTIVRLVILGNLEAALEKTMQLSGADQGLKLKVGTLSY